MPCCACHIPHEEIHSTLQDWSCTGTIAMLFRNQHNFEGEGRTTSPDTNHFQTPMPPASQLIDSWHIDDVMGTYPPCFAKCPAQHFQNVDHMHFTNSKKIRTHDPSTHRPISTFPSPSSALGLPSAKASIFFSRTIILSYQSANLKDFTAVQLHNFPPDSEWCVVPLHWSPVTNCHGLKLPGYLPAPRSMESGGPDHHHLPRCADCLWWRTQAFRPGPMVRKCASWSAESESKSHLLGQLCHIRMICL